MPSSYAWAVSRLLHWCCRAAQSAELNAAAAAASAAQEATERYMPDPHLRVAALDLRAPARFDVPITVHALYAHLYETTNTVPVPCAAVALHALALQLCYFLALYWHCRSCKDAQDCLAA